MCDDPIVQSESYTEQTAFNMVKSDVEIKSLLEVLYLPPLLCG